MPINTYNCEVFIIIKIDLFKELSLYENEYVFLVKKIPLGSSSFPVKIPKLMPFVSLGEKENNVKFDANIFVNDKACKPSIGKQFTEKGFITVRKHGNTSFKHLEGPKDQLNKGLKLRLMYMNHNIRDCYIVSS